MSFWGSLFGGSNPTLNRDINQFGQIGSFATGQGESNLSQASNFMSSILSGDQSKIGKVLGPEISSVKGQGQQAKMQTAQFGTRGGGSNAAMQAADDKSRAAVNSMISSLVGGSASGLASTGSSLLGTGISAYGQQLAASQQQMQNWSKSIFGHFLISGAQTAEEMGELYATKGQSTQAAGDYSSGPGS
jgi:hypothetical protein